MRRFSWLIVIVLALTTPSFAEEEHWIPASASNAGQHGTMWTTELWIASRVVDAPIDVRAAFFPEQAGTAEPQEVTITIQPSTQVEILDAVGTLFDEHRPGAIRLRSEHPFVAQSRTANDGGSMGSYGQGIPACDFAQAAGWWDFIGASNVPGDDGIRTNIGIVNVGNQEHDVLISARDGETLDPLGTVFVEIGPNGWYQADVFALFGLNDQTVKLADIGVWAIEAELMSYLSRVDNQSGDPTYVQPMDTGYVRIESRLWEVEGTLAYTGSTVVERLDYTTADGTVSVEDPESGFTTGVLDLYSPTTFCLRAVGEYGPNPATIEFEIMRRPEDDPTWATGRTRILWGAGAGVHTFDEDHCITLD